MLQREYLVITEKESVLDAALTEMKSVVEEEEFVTEMNSVVEEFPEGEPYLMSWHAEG